jgi:hypothetical protein
LWFCCWVATRNSIVIVVLFIGIWLCEYCIVAIVQMACSVYDGILWKERNLENPVICAGRRCILWYWELLAILSHVFLWGFRSKSCYVHIT